MTWYLIGERGNQGHPHDPGLARSTMTDTLMTLTLRQVDTIFIAQLTNQHAGIKYLHEPMKLCYVPMHWERVCHPQTNTIKMMCHSWKNPVTPSTKIGLINLERGPKNFTSRTKQGLRTTLKHVVFLPNIKQVFVECDYCFYMIKLHRRESREDDFISRRKESQTAWRMDWHV
jgi:hypothetical protein